MRHQGDVWRSLSLQVAHKARLVSQHPGQREHHNPGQRQRLRFLRQYHLNRTNSYDLRHSLLRRRSGSKRSHVGQGIKLMTVWEESSTNDSTLKGDTVVRARPMIQTAEEREIKVYCVYDSNTAATLIISDSSHRLARAPLHAYRLVPAAHYPLSSSRLQSSRTATLLYQRPNSADINLGLRDYGRRYTLTDPVCHQTDCKWDSVSRAGSCTNVPELVSLEEISSIIPQLDVQPSLLQDDMKKQITWNNQWT